MHLTMSPYFAAVVSRVQVLLSQSSGSGAYTIPRTAFVILPVQCKYINTHTHTCTQACTHAHTHTNTHLDFVYRESADSNAYLQTSLFSLSCILVFCSTYYAPNCGALLLDWIDSQCSTSGSAELKKEDIPSYLRLCYYPPAASEYCSWVNNRSQDEPRCSDFQSNPNYHKGKCGIGTLTVQWVKSWMDGL